MERLPGRAHREAVLVQQCSCAVAHEQHPLQNRPILALRAWLPLHNRDAVDHPCPRLPEHHHVPVLERLQR
eukprot:853068-Pyramimonas_sp.AAC.1